MDTHISPRGARWLTLLALVLLTQASRAFAQPIAQTDIPPELRPWVPWVLEETMYGCTLRDTASLGNDVNPTGGAATTICVWPGDLRVRVTNEGGTFELEATSDRRAPLTLPGGGRRWPVDVRVDGAPAVVLISAGQPVLWLTPGKHRIEGRIPWTSIPETLAVPADIARVSLEREGQTTSPPRGTTGEIWLRGGASEASEEDHLGLDVQRLIEDGSPLSLTTRIALRVSGRARELRLPNVLPEGITPVEITADLPVRLSANGELTLQLHAGTFTVTIQGLGANPDATFTRPNLDAPWPGQEVWVWSANESFRQVEVQGANGIDPQRTSLPEAWRSFSAFLVDQDTRLTLHTTRRGEPTPPPNQVAITRDVWFDLDGNGYTARDQLQITMHSGHRIELTEGVLGRMSLGSGQDQLITQRTESGRPGVELRSTSQPFTAEWRMESHGATLPAVNWSENATSSTTTLHLPPGWELLHASGVDRAPGTWWERWSLLAFFGLILIVAAVGRVYGVQWGAVALVGLGLAFHEPGTPQWLWLILAALAALHAALLASKTSIGPKLANPVRWAYWGFGAIALVMVVSFATQQITAALYPQLEAPSNNGWSDQGGLFEMGDMTRTTTLEESSIMGAPSVVGGSGSSGRYGIQGSLSENAYWLDPNAIVQTGFGVPTWSWTGYTLSFDGPVEEGAMMHLYLLPPWAFRIVAALRAVLLLVLLGVLLFKRPKAPTDETPSTEGDTNAPSAAAVGSVAILLITMLASSAHAQTPSQEVLTDLRNRLTRRAPCGERCSEANAMHIEVRGDVLVIELDVSAMESAAYPLPGPSETWTPSTITLDGAPLDAMIRLENGFIHARIPEGAHRLRLEGTLQNRDALTLAFGRAPRSLTTTVEGWEVDGLGTDERMAESIQLRRTLRAENSAAGEHAGEHAELPSWLEVSRRIDIGVRWTVSTTVRRRSPANVPAVARVPLLPGESVTDAAVVIENGTALVTLGQRDTETTWTSVLTPSDVITLTAPASGRITEVWTLACSPLWHCEHEGLAATNPVNAQGVWEPTFHPWPSETLNITLTRPLAAEGQSLTVDSASLTITPGIRLTTSALTASVRTSTSTPFSITLPPDSDVQSLSVDGIARPLQREGDQVVVSLQPGPHTISLNWQSGTGWQMLVQTPQVSLGSASANIELLVSLSPDRWLLFTTGPAWGPAILFWPYLLLALGFAFVLARQKGIPLKLHDWVLLLVGLTQIPAVAALFVIGWFFFVRWRSEKSELANFVFDARQLALVGYTFIAFCCLLWAIESGLLGEPAMMIEGPSCHASQLRFFVDRTEGVLPSATLLSLPVEVYKVLMFVWAIWLVVSVLRWTRWGWAAFGHDGIYRDLFASKSPAPSFTPAPATEEVIEAPASEGEAPIDE